MAEKTITIFVSYAPKDSRLCKELNKHLSQLKRQGLIITWYDQEISAGTAREDEITAHLDIASVILLLISPDFLASDYIYHIEMEHALRRHEANEARVIPILLRPVDWKSAPFAHLQMLPTNARPITTWTNQDEAFVNVAADIRQVIEDLTFHSGATHQVVAPSVWNVPYRRNPFFTGREDLIRRLHEQLTTVKSAALTQAQAISGLGGIGKTQIALEYAHQYRDNYHYVFWVSAATRETLISDFVTIADLLHLPEKNENNQNLVIIAVKKWLSTQHGWLLILDNADDVAMVKDFVPASGKGHIILTSRAQAMGSLAERIDVERMGIAESTLFLLHRAKLLAQEAFLNQASEEHLAGAEAIAIEMDFLPLALDQAGAYIEEIGISLSAYLGLYRAHRKGLLQRKSLLSTDYPKSVATTWSLSFQKIEQVNPAAAELLRLCAFLEPDAIPEDLISGGSIHLGPVLRGVAGDALKLNEAIGELRKFSLVQRNSNTETLSIHRLVQAVLIDAMEQGAQRQWAKRVLLAVSSVFPSDTDDVEMWPQCLRYLSQVQVCYTLVGQYRLTLTKAASLLNRTAGYLKCHALYTVAEPLIRRALAIYEQELGPLHPKTADSLSSLASLYYGQGKYDQAEHLYTRAVSIYEQELGPLHPDFASSLFNFAGLYCEQRKYEQAEQLYMRTLAIGLAMLYNTQEKCERAEPLLVHILETYEQKLGPLHPDTAYSLNNLVKLYQAQGKYEQAELSTMADFLNNFAILYYMQGKYEQVEPLLIRALAIYEQELGPQHLDVAKSLNNLAELYQAQGKYKQVEPLLMRALAIHEQELGPEHPLVATSLTNLAIFYQAQGNFAEAERLYKRALHIREQRLGMDHPHTQAVRENYTALLRTMGRDEETK